MKECVGNFGKYKACFTCTCVGRCISEHQKKSNQKQQEGNKNAGDKLYKENTALH